MSESVGGIYTKKPWGYEYTLYKDLDVLIWKLFIRSGEKTSFHCHPNKTTMMIVLKGKIRLTIGDLSSYLLYPFDSKVLNKGMYHSSEAVDDNAELIEIDNPPLVEDVIRLDDKYGREGEDFYPKKKI